MSRLLMLCGVGTGCGIRVARVDLVAQYNHHITVRVPFRGWLLYKGAWNQEKGERGCIPHSFGVEGPASEIAGQVSPQGRAALRWAGVAILVQRLAWPQTELQMPKVLYLQCCVRMLTLQEALQTNASPKNTRAAR